MLIYQCLTTSLLLAETTFYLIWFKLACKGTAYSIHPADSGIVVSTEQVTLNVTLSMLSSYV